MKTPHNSPTVTADTIAHELLNEVQRIETLAHPLIIAGYSEEAHYQAALHYWLRTCGIGHIFIEAQYPGDRWHERCDIVVLGSSPIWIELKRSWLGYGKGWNTKPREQIRNLLWDCAKLLELLRIERVGRGIVATLFYNQETAPFSSRAVAPGVSMKKPALQSILQAWAQGKITWSAVASALGIPTRMSANDLRTWYISILKPISKITLQSLEKPSRGLNYSVVAAEFELASDST